MALTVKETLQGLVHHRNGARVLAVTEHGSNSFEVIAVEGDLPDDVTLRLRIILPEVVEDREGDTWGLQSDGTYSVVNLESGWVADSSWLSRRSLADIEREFGLKR